MVCQQLVPKTTGGLALAVEVMIPNAAIRNLIREDKIHQIYSQMQIGQSKHGMQTMNQSLCELVNRRLVNIDEALSKSSDTDELRNLIAGRVPNAPAARPPAGKG